MKKLDMLRWFDVHFPESTFHGRFQLGYRKKGQCALLPLVTNEREELREFLSEMFVSPHCDYYITGNSVSGTKRKTESLFSFHNIVIDVDLHGMMDGEGKMGNHFLIEEFIWRFSRDSEIPSPSSIVKTGRGLQFWWNIVPVHQKCKIYLDQVRNFFMEEIKGIIEEYSDLSDFSVDVSASSNDVGYFRLPFTQNTKVKVEATAILSENVEAYVLQDLVASVKSIQRENEKETVVLKRDKELIRDFAKHEIFVLKNVQTLAFFRIRQLILLRKIRDNKINGETRNNLNFLVYNCLLPSLGEELAWEKLLSFNRGFKSPMTEKELEAVIVSAREKGGYKYSNKKVIEFLNITPEEQEKIELFQGKGEGVVRFSQHPSRDALRSLEKESRNLEIQKLAESGKSIKVIAQMLEIHPETVSKVLGKKEKNQQKKEMALEMLTAGSSMGEIIVVTGLSRSSIKRLKASKEEIRVQ